MSSDTNGDDDGGDDDARLRLVKSYQSTGAVGDFEWNTLNNFGSGSNMFMPVQECKFTCSDLSPVTIIFTSGQTSSADKRLMCR
jgi:hypothetical protein